MTAPRRRPPRAPGALGVVAVIFLASAAARAVAVGDAAGQGASEIGAPPETGADPLLELVAPELTGLLRDARERHAALDRREAALDRRAATLQALRDEIDSGLRRLKTAEDGLRDRLARADEAAEGDVARLTSVYENMEPEVAATLFARMEPSFAAGFLGRMRPDSAAAILAGLETDQAYAISVVLAGRNVGLADPDAGGGRD